MGWSSESGRIGSRGLGSWSEGIQMLRYCRFRMEVKPLILLHPSQPRSVPTLLPAQIVKPCAFAYGKILPSRHVFVRLLGG